jgi:hypothetical protein
MKEIKIYRTVLYVTLFFALFVNLVLSAPSKKSVPVYSSVIRTVTKLKENSNVKAWNKISKGPQNFKANIYKREKSNGVNSVQDDYQDWEGGYGIEIEQHGEIEDFDFAQMEIKFLMLKNLSTLGKGSFASNVKISPIQIESNSEQGIVFDLGSEEPCEEIKKVLIKKDNKKNRWYLPYRLSKSEFDFNKGLHTLKFLETWLINENKQIFKFTLILPIYKFGVGQLDYKGQQIKNLLNDKRLEVPESSNLMKKKMFDVAHTIITQAMLTKFIKAKDVEEAISHVRKYYNKKQMLEKIIISDSTKKKAEILKEEIEDIESYVESLNSQLEESEESTKNKIQNEENNFESGEDDEDEDTFDYYSYSI